jgi:hypothetical protein
MAETVYIPRLPLTIKFGKWWYHCDGYFGNNTLVGKTGNVTAIIDVLKWGFVSRRNGRHERHTRPPHDAPPVEAFSD